MNIQERQTKREVVKMIVQAGGDLDLVVGLIESLYLADEEETIPQPVNPNHTSVAEINTVDAFRDLFNKVAGMVARHYGDTTLTTLAREIGVSVLSAMAWRDGRMTRVPNRKSVEKLVATHNRLV